MRFTLTTIVFLSLIALCTAWPQWLHVPKPCKGENEVFRVCGASCPDTCETLRQNGGGLPSIGGKKAKENKKSMLCKICTPGCKCINGYVLEKKGGHCVPKTACAP
ncbi:hypothetical protein M3Y98_00035000 [Aphelenchoides besseyi]|nr:hypothetical protein M3Y98_00035000 [Aphelenchoides besseyi]